MPIDKILMAGHAQLPQGMAAKSLFDTLAISVVFEARYGVIIVANATVATDTGRDHFASILVGRSLNDPLEDVITDIRTLYQGAAQNALVAAAKDLWRRYAAWQETRPQA